MTYFKNVQNLEQLRKQYKELLKIYHPDCPNGSTEACQAINAEYDKLFKELKDKHESKQTSKEENNKAGYSDMQWNFEEDAALREVLQKVIYFENIVIELCGSWIWISGNTYQYKDELKEIGFKYAPKKRSWYWHSEAFRKKGKKTLSMDDIRNYYGSTEFRAEERRLLKEA